MVWRCLMKRLLDQITDRLADAALLEMGIPAALINGETAHARETLEESFVEVAFAEAADYDDIHEAIRREHEVKGIARPGDRHAGNDDADWRSAA